MVISVELLVKNRVIRDQMHYTASQKVNARFAELSSKEALMKSPADMQIIQIDITNACTKKCSNCTRCCGNHLKPFMLDLDCFNPAFASMDGFSVLVSIMG